MAEQLEVNSPDYWDQRFQGDWASNDGGQYTRAYAELCLEYLPDSFQSEMRRSNMSICDWGCAEGEAASYFSQMFPGSPVCGVDVSPKAVENARSKFPGVEFAAADWLLPDAELPRFDVVFTSHVLEHFPNPLQILSKVLGQVADKMIIALFPYAEDPARKDPEHFFRFLDANMPAQWDGWSCMFFRVLDTRMRRGPCWRGQQALVVYGRNDWGERLALAPFLSAFRGETDALKAERAACQDKIQQLEKELVLSAKKLEIQFMHDQNFVRVNESLRQQITALTNRQADLNKAREALEKEREELSRGLGELKRELGELEIARKSAQAQLAEKNAQVMQLTHRNEQLRGELARAERAYAETNATLKWPPAIAAFYARALWRRVRRVLSQSEPGGNAGAAPSGQGSQPASQDAPRPDNQAPPAPPMTESPTPQTPSMATKIPDTPTSAPEASRQSPETAMKITSRKRTSARKQAALEDVRVPSILDTFSHACLAPDCTLIPIGTRDWPALLDSCSPDFLFVESAWNGNDGGWQFRVASYASPAGRELDDVLAWCNAKDIPTVFWNKEDPPNFDRFIDAAAKFDYVFTTDDNCVDEYRRRCGHDRIAPLPFAAQPAIHNPVLQAPRLDRVCFAGTYYADCFPERRRHMENMLGGCIPYGLDIYDRMFGHEGSDKARFLFPGQFQPYIRGKLEYAEMLGAYRQYRAFLNVNSVHDSPTMFARRVFELLACGTPVISTPSLGMEQMFGSLMPQVRTEVETRRALQELLGDEMAWMRRSALGVRRVMSEHTYSHRLQTVCRTIGLDAAADREPPCVVVLLPGADVERTARELAAQTIPPRCVYVPGGDAGAAAQRAALNAAGFDAPEVQIEQLAGIIRREHHAAAVAFMNGRHAYGPEYLRDGLQPLFYSGCDCSGMDGHFQADDDGCAALAPGDRQACFIHDACLGATLVIRAAALDENLLHQAWGEEHVHCGRPCFLRYPFEFLANSPEVFSDAARSVVLI